MISSILKTAGLITLLFGAWVLFTVQSGKDTGTGRLIDKVSNLKTSAISTVKPSGDKKESGSTSWKSFAASENLDGKTEDMKSEKSGLLAKTGHKENSSKDDIDNMFNTKTILPEDPEERITAAGEKRAPALGARMTALNTSEGRFDTDAKEPTDVQLQSAQKRLAESIIKLETTINGFWRR